MTDVDRYVAGMAVVFDEPDLHDRIWRAGQFRSFVSAEFALPVLFEHRDPSDLLGQIEMGTWRQFAIYEGDGDIPPGLVTFGELTNEHMLEMVRRSLLPGSDHGPYGLSMRAANMGDTDAGPWWLSEVSLTSNPAVPRARVFGVGQDALTRFEMLTGERARV